MIAYRCPMAASLPPLRPARLDEVDAIEDLMREAMRVLFPRYYDEVQTASCVAHVAIADPMVIGDGTYYVAETDDGLVACGGWSLRDKLYTGSASESGEVRELDPATEPARVRAMFVRPDWTRRGLGWAILDECEHAARERGFRTMSLMATLPGVPLYQAFGFEALEEMEVVLADGVVLPCVRMTRPIT
jgi:GNAT superfamily N-acetyltransferase